MAADRLNSSTSRPSARPSSNSNSRISKPRQQRRGNDRGMEIDQVGSSRGSGGGRNNRSKNGNNNNNRRRGNDSKRSSKPKALNQSDLDKDLESYMMKNESTAKNTLDMELDSYMSTAPSKV